MKSLVRPSFWRAYAALDPRVRLAARRAYRLFAENPEHPSLRFKRLQGYDHVWSVRINEQFRAVGAGRTLAHAVRLAEVEDADFVAETGLAEDGGGGAIGGFDESGDKADALPADRRVTA